MNPVPETENTDSRWLGLYKMGGVTALIIAVLLVGEVFVYAILPSPDTSIEYFALFHANWLAGLLTLDLLGTISYILFVPTILAFYMALRRTSESVTLVAAVLFFVGIADFFATNTAFPMFSLSSQYAAATTDAERAIYLAAGQAMLTLFDENAFLVSYVIVSASWVMISSVMLKGRVFSRVTAYAGILAGAAGIVAVVLEHVLSKEALFAAISLYFAAIVFLILWVILSGRQLYRLGNVNRKG